MLCNIFNVKNFILCDFLTLCYVTILYSNKFYAINLLPFTINTILKIYTSANKYVLIS